MLAAQKCEQWTLMYGAQSCAIHAPQLHVCWRLWRVDQDASPFVWGNKTERTPAHLNSTLRRLAAKELLKKFLSLISVNSYQHDSDGIAILMEQAHLKYGKVSVVVAVCRQIPFVRMTVARRVFKVITNPIACNFIWSVSQASNEGRGIRLQYYN